MTENGANKPPAGRKGSNAAQSGQLERAKQAVSDTNMKSEQQSPTSSSLENIRLRLGLDRTQIKQPFDVLYSQQSSWQERVKAIQTLVTQGKQPAASKFIEDCIQNKNEDIRVREAALRALGELRKAGYVFRDALFGLIWQLDVSESTLYAMVIDALASAGSREWDEGPEIRTYIVQKLSSPKTPTNIRASLVRLLATLGKQAPVKEIVALLNETNLEWNIRNAIVTSLDESFTAVFEKLLYDPEQSIRVSAAYRLGKELALQRILQILRTSRDYVIKDRVARVLGEVGKGTDEEISVLASIASNQQNNTLVRISALLATGQLRERHAHVKEPERLLRRLREDSNKSIRVVAKEVTAIFTRPFADNEDEYEPDEDGND